MFYSQSRIIKTSDYIETNNKVMEIIDSCRKTQSVDPTYK